MTTNLRQLCMTFLACCSVIIVVMMFSAILLFFLSTQPHTAPPTDDPAAVTADNASLRIILVNETNTANDSRTAVIIVAGPKNIEKLFNKFQNGTRQNFHPQNDTKEKNASDAMKKLFREKLRTERLVGAINGRRDSPWTARLNPTAIGSETMGHPPSVDGESFELRMSESAEHRHEAMMSDFFDKMRKLTQKFSPLYDIHLALLERNSRSRFAQESLSNLSAEYESSFPFRDASSSSSSSHFEFNAVLNWPNCAENMARILNQGACGSCYAHATVSAITDRVCIFSKGKVRSPLSAQQIIDCCPYCGGCNGTTDTLLSFIYWFESGLVTEQCHPSTVDTDCGYPCKLQMNYPWRPNANCDAKVCANPRHIFQPYYAKYVYKVGNLNQQVKYGVPSLFTRYKTLRRMMSNNNTLKLQQQHLEQKQQQKQQQLQYHQQPHHQKLEGDSIGRLPIRSVSHLLKLELTEFGPVVLCFSVYEGFLHYFEGVYDFSREPDERFIYDHCVKVIGFGDYLRPNGTTGEYLLAVNSWSARWAKDGTFKIDLAELERQNRSDLYAGIPYYKSDFS